MHGEIFYGGQKRHFVRMLRANCGNMLKYETYSPAGVKPLPGCIV